MLRMRKEVPEIGWGDFDVLPLEDASVLILRYRWRNNNVVFLHNLAAEAKEITFKAEDAEGPEVLLVNLLSDDHSRGDKQGRHTVILEPYGYRWFRIGGLDYLLKRSAA